MPIVNRTFADPLITGEYIYESSRKKHEEDKKVQAIELDQRQQALNLQARAQNIQSQQHSADRAANVAMERDRMARQEANREDEQRHAQEQAELQSELQIREQRAKGGFVVPDFSAGPGHNHAAAIGNQAVIDDLNSLPVQQVLAGVHQGDPKAIAKAMGMGLMRYSPEDEERLGRLRAAESEVNSSTALSPLDRVRALNQIAAQRSMIQPQLIPEAERPPDMNQMLQKQTGLWTDPTTGKQWPAQLEVRNGIPMMVPIETPEYTGEIERQKELGKHRAAQESGAAAAEAEKKKAEAEEKQKAAQEAAQEKARKRYADVRKRLFDERVARHKAATEAAAAAQINGQQPQPVPDVTDPTDTEVMAEISREDAIARRITGQGQQSGATGAQTSAGRLMDSVLGLFTGDSWGPSSSPQPQPQQPQQPAGTPAPPTPNQPPAAAAAAQQPSPSAVAIGQAASAPPTAVPPPTPAAAVAEPGRGTNDAGPYVEPTPTGKGTTDAGPYVQPGSTPPPEYGVDLPDESAAAGFKGGKTIDTGIDRELPKGQHPAVDKAFRASKVDDEHLQMLNRVEPHDPETFAHAMSSRIEKMELPKEVMDKVGEPLKRLREAAKTIKDYKSKLRKEKISSISELVGHGVTESEMEMLSQFRMTIDNPVSPFVKDKEVNKQLVGTVFVVKFPDGHRYASFNDGKKMIPIYQVPDGYKGRDLESELLGAMGTQDAISNIGPAQGMQRSVGKYGIEHAKDLYKMHGGK